MGNSIQSIAAAPGLVPGPHPLAHLTHPILRLSNPSMYPRTPSLPDGGRPRSASAVTVLIYNIRIRVARAGTFPLQVSARYSFCIDCPHLPGPTLHLRLHKLQRNAKKNPNQLGPKEKFSTWAFSQYTCVRWVLGAGKRLRSL